MVAGAECVGLQYQTWSSGGPHTNLATDVSVTGFQDNTTAANTTYGYVVTALNGGGESTNSSPASVATPTALVPAAPATVTATPTDAQIILNWSAVPGATSYNVKRGPNGGPFTNLTTGAVATFADSAVTSGVTYYYVVSAVNASGESANSVQTSAALLTKLTGTVIGTAGSFNNSGNTKEKGVRQQPRHILRRADGQRHLGRPGFRRERRQRRWGDPVLSARHLREPHDRRRIPGRERSQLHPARRRCSPSPPRRVQHAHAATHHRNQRLPARALPARTTAMVTSPRWNSGAAAPQPPLPVTPTGVAAAAGDGVVTLNWNASVNATGYNVKRELVSGGAYSPLAPTGATNYADATAANGTRYFYVVTATNLAGESGNSWKLRRNRCRSRPPK